FTGAAKKRAGRFEAADEGSLFLDEIATMSMAAQEKLLRVIEYGEFERVGGTDTITIDVRIVAATNIDLPSAADKGEFRHDLLDRLAFDVITVPPLRERAEDIPILAAHFGMQMARELEWLQFPGFTADAMDKMLAYAWPGNIRELKNVVERAVYRAWDGEEPLCDIVFDPFESPFRPAAPMRQPEADVTDTASLPEAATKPAVPTKAYCLRTEIKSVEKTLLTNALETNRFNQRATAKFLNLSYDQLRHTLKKQEITI
ncbi:MAG: sigma 54-interacting transcriptional regulator, partial [Kordiimonadaceae bacterium]|nr:sigma 54-interacting transcriptional regulator [Kordiimonadaceae bacterium]